MRKRIVRHAPLLITVAHSETAADKATVRPDHMLRTTGSLLAMRVYSPSSRRLQNPFQFANESSGPGCRGCKSQGQLKHLRLAS